MGAKAIKLGSKILSKISKILENSLNIFIVYQKHKYEDIARKNDS